MIVATSTKSLREIFDEFEEWILMMTHYAVAAASNSADATLPPFF